MAYRSKTKRRTSRRRATPVSKRRRRIGAAPARKQNAARMLGVVAGVILPQFLAGKTVMGITFDNKVLGAVSAGLGYFAPRFVKGDFVEGVGLGMIGSGGALLLKGFNVLSGIPIIAGWQDMKAINGAPAASPTFEQPVATRLRNSANVNSFRPSVSQVFNGVYNRRPMDGTYD